MFCVAVIVLSGDEGILWQQYTLSIIFDTQKWYNIGRMFWTFEVKTFFLNVMELKLRILTTQFDFIPKIIHEICRYISENAHKGLI